jgi:glyoxylase-like metal-dependent hydrolase (beta-lactamase superfamily II)
VIALLALSWAFSAGAAPAFPKVGHYTSSSWGFSTNSFWIEGPSGVILVDTQFLPSATAELLETAQRYTGKKVLLAVVLHANPDKFNGTGYLQARGIRVVTSAAVRALIPGVDALRRRWFYARYKPDYPEKLALPSSFGAGDTTLEVAGLTLKFTVLGPATSAAHVVLSVEGHVFVGDLLANRHHSWLELGNIAPWQARLDEIAALKPRYLYPGRGYPSDATLLDVQKRYLEFVQSTVLAASQNLHTSTSSSAPGTLTPAQRSQLIGQITTEYKGYQNEFFVERAVDVLFGLANKQTNE